MTTLDDIAAQVAKIATNQESQMLAAQARQSENAKNFGALGAEIKTLREGFLGHQHEIAHIKAQLKGNESIARGASEAAADLQGAVISHVAKLEKAVAEQILGQATATSSLAAETRRGLEKLDDRLKDQDQEQADQMKVLQQQTSALAQIQSAQVARDAQLATLLLVAKFVGWAIPVSAILLGALQWLIHHA